MEAMYIGATGATADNSIGILPQLPVPVNYPQYNSLALLPVDYANNYSASVSGSTSCFGSFASCKQQTQHCRQVQPSVLLLLVMRITHTCATC